jgi:dTDP-4-amino-4,6-dideoxygalactose transaminase
MEADKMSQPIHVAKSFLPPIEEYEKYLEGIWRKSHLTNGGPLALEFEQKIRRYLGVNDFQFVANGTLALQLAISGLGLGGGYEIITTPFSYVATTSAIMWQGCKPIYVDIDPETLCINPDKIEAAITPKTKAILAVHVFGNACNFETIQKIAEKHKLKIIYDGAHAFGAKYNGRSLLDYGDVSVTSFHATKLFHTIEGGGIICKDRKVSERIDLQKRFGHNYDNYKILGINAKANEFQAAMGLANLKYVGGIINKRREICELYDKLLGDTVDRPKFSIELVRNYAYYPVLFPSEKILREVFAALGKENIFPRRYFYPSLDKLPYTSGDCPISNNIASRIACLPLYHDLKTEDTKNITKIIEGCFNS